MRHRVPLVALAALVALSSAGALAAQEAAKVGLVNTQEILEKSAEGQRTLARLQDTEKKYQAAVARLDGEAKQLQDRLSAQRLTLTPEAAAQIQAELQKKLTERRRTAEDAARSMRELQYSLLTKIREELVAVMEEIRKEKGLDVVLDTIKVGAVFYIRPLDLSAEVIRRYDASKAAPPAKK
jgi:outer membrane protein